MPAASPPPLLLASDAARGERDAHGACGCAWPCNATVHVGCSGGDRRAADAAWQGCCAERWLGDMGQEAWLHKGAWTATSDAAPSTPARPPLAAGLARGALQGNATPLVAALRQGYADGRRVCEASPSMGFASLALWVSMVKKSVL